MLGRIIFGISIVLGLWFIFPFVIMISLIIFLVTMIINFIKSFESSMYITPADVGKTAIRRDSRKALISHYDLETNDKLCVWVTTDERSYLVDCEGFSRNPDVKKSACDLVDMVIEDPFVPAYQKEYWNVAISGEKGYIMYGKEKRPVSPMIHSEVACYITDLHNKSLEKR